MNPMTSGKMLMMNDLIWLTEPQLEFHFGQALEDPRDGLRLFGPLDEGKPYGIRAGVIGTRDGIRRFKNWVERINLPIHDFDEGFARPPFLGFETVFRIPWDPKPLIELEIPIEDIEKAVHLDDKHQRVFKTVDLYSSRILKAVREEDIQVDLWFVIVPDIVYIYCRPKSSVEAWHRITTDRKMSIKYAQTLLTQPSLFPQDNVDARPYHYEVNFHNQLKARLLEARVLTQLIRESTIAPWEFYEQYPRRARGQEKLQASIAWNLTTATFYKAGGRPWKISAIREGVCYIGIVFKQLATETSSSKNACCAAQMFLDSGDGLVFKGNVGPWYNPNDGDYHLSRNAARELVQIALETYQSKTGKPPAELFLHGRVAFDDDEWRGFRDAAGDNINLVGVRIRENSDLKLFRKAKMPVLRGMAYISSKRMAYLWTKGYIPRLQTYPGREVPNPIQIKINRGKADIDLILRDILGLTKLNYNTCIFGDGVPVTLKFADAVGEILTAGPIKGDVPLPFKHYI